MNKNDLIRRGDVKAKKVYCRERHEYVVPVAEIDWLPLPPQPLSAVEFARNLARMCLSHTCGRCPFHKSEKFRVTACIAFERDYPEEAVAIVQKWAAEHPEEVSDEI